MVDVEQRLSVVREHLTENPNAGKRTIARILLDKYPELWKNIEQARASVRYYTGQHGEHSRKQKPANKIIDKADPNMTAILSKIGQMFTPQELQAIANGGRLMPGYAKVPIINFNGGRIRIGGITDTHIGSKYFNKERLFQAFDEFRKENVDIVAHVGDVTEGMSGRPGHVYELDQIGYDRQRQEAIEVLSNWKGKMYLIDGNHDRWFIKSNGALIVKDIAAALPNAEFLGHDEGDISLGGKATLKLWHGEDGSSYAVSYRLQKVIESLSGGEKPSVMFFGHTHKSTYLFERNVHCYSMGSIQSQSAWMRGKRIAAHTGFWIVDIWVNKSGVSKTSGTFYPFYT